MNARSNSLYDLSQRGVSSIEEDAALLNTVDIVGLWPDFVTWEDTPFRPSDDVTLLSYGFHFGSDGTTLTRSDGWRVDCSKPVPIWYRNGERIGSMSYDTVVNTFRTKE